MSKRLLRIPVVALALAICSAGGALADVGECKTRIELVQADLVNLGPSAFSGNNAQRNYDGLMGKLTYAVGKLGQGKFADSSAKLGDFIASVNALAGAAKPKLSADGANLLLWGDGGSEQPLDAGAVAAKACVDAL